MSEMEQYNILIVDEDEATRCTLADLLRGRGEYRVLVAGEGREAVRMFVEESRIDIVLTDIHMPGFNCLELMSDMQVLKHRPEILVMTSDGSAEVIEQARQIGARSIILKPFEHLDLIEGEVEKAVQALFESRATTSCRMMAPPSTPREPAAPGATPAGAPAKTETAESAKPAATATTTKTPRTSLPSGPSPESRPAPPEKNSLEENIFVGNATPEAPRGVPGETPSAATAKPIEIVEAPPAPTSPLESADAGLTMRIDRPDFAVAPPPPAAQPVIKTKDPAQPVAANAESGKPATETTAAPVGEPDRRDPRRSPAADRARGRVGLPNLGVLKSKLFGKGPDLKGGHLARAFPDLAPGGVPPASPPATPDTSPEAPRSTSLSLRAGDRPAGSSLAEPAPSKQGTPGAEPVELPNGTRAAKETTEAEETQEIVDVHPTAAASALAPETEDSGPMVFELEDPEEEAAVTPPIETTPKADPIVPAKETVRGVDAIPATMETVQAVDAIPPPMETVQGVDAIPPPRERAQGSESITPAIEIAVGPEPGDSSGTGATTGADSAAQEEQPGGEALPSVEKSPDDQVVAAAGEADRDGAAAVPAELETILAAGADVDIEKMTLQIPIICLQTWEEQAALDALRPMAGTMKRAFHTWSATRGIVKEDGTVMGEMYCDPIQALEFIRRQKANGLFALIDFHNCLEDRKVVRMLREMFDGGETGRGMLVLTGPTIPIPPELQPACQLFDWPRSAAVDFDQVLEEVRSELTSDGGDAIDLDPEARRLLIDRVQGMPAGRVRFEFLCALRGRGPGGA